MLKWLLIALFIYLIYKLITGPTPAKRKRKRSFRFGGFQRPDAGHQSRRRPDLDQIEEAEFEDITETEKKSENQ